MFNVKFTLKAIHLFLVIIIVCGAIGCSKANSEAESCLTAKWQIVAKSVDGVTWQAISSAETHFLEFNPNGLLLYSDLNTNCSGTYTLTGEQLVTDLSACSAHIYFSHRIMLQSSSTLILRPNSGAILPYTKYIKVH